LIKPRAAPESYTWSGVQRLAALRDFDIIDTANEAAFDDITQLASDACQAPVAVVSFLDAERQWFKSQIGLGLSETSLDASICARTIHQSELVVIPDTEVDERLAGLVPVPGLPGMRFYAGARLETSEGQLLGALCVCDHVPRPGGLTERQAKTLLTLSRAVMRELELRRANKALAEKTAQLNATLEHVGQGILMVDADRNVVVCNQRAIELLDLPPDMMLSTPSFDDVKRWQQEQGEFVGADPALISTIAKDINEPAGVYHRRRPNGTVLEICTKRLPDGGGVRTFTDITARKAAEEAAAGSEARYRSLCDALPQKVLVTAADGMITYQNRQFTDYYGPIGPDLEARARLTHPDDRDAIGTSRAEALALGQPVQGEARLLRQDGTYRWHHMTFNPIILGGGITEWVSTSLDIEELRETRLKLHESEERYKFAALAASDAIWEWDLATDMLHWGEGADVLFYCTRAELPGTASAWLTQIHPRDRDGVERKLQDFIAGTAERWEDEYRLRQGDGGYAYVSDRGFVLRDAAGAPIRLVGAIKDLTDKRRADVALQTSEERLRLALAATGLGIWDIDLVAGRQEWSPEVRQILGLPENAVAGRRNFLPQIHPDDREHIASTFYPEIDNVPPEISATFRVIGAEDGDVHWVEVGGRTLFDGDGRPVRMLGTIQDVTTRKIAEEGLRIGNERLRLALQASSMVAWELDMQRGWVNRSDNSGALLGLGSGPASDFGDNVHPDDRHKLTLMRLAAFAEGSHATEVRYFAADGSQLWLALRAERKDEHRLIGITFDISERKATEAAIWQTANLDPLTGLANRALFQIRLEEALATAEKDGTGVGLLLLDLDDFKDVNDTLGHAAGDQLLAETATRLAHLVSERDTVARVGGDEFAIILVEQQGLLEIAVAAKAIVEGLRTTFDVEGRALSTKASIGVAAFPEHHRDPVELMKDADIALYRAKEGGRSRAVVYTSAARELMERRVTILRDVRNGVAASEFLPLYQPKVSLATGQIVGFEALARWRHPTKGLLTPAYFGSAFEDAEISSALATSLIRQVVGNIRQWLDEGVACGRIAVNLASADFADRTLASRIIDMLDDARVPASMFEVEVTETVFLGRKTEAAAAILSEFHEAGVSIALDDFGTGFASLTHLKQFPVDHIKIDQSFVRNLETDDDDAAIVAAIVSLGRNMGKHITAEGVENAGQVKRLREAGCDFGQGYLYARPSPGEDVAGIVRNWSAPRQHGLRQSMRRLIRQV
jgi:diguanylate cyclase (GGDEF)-like protein/PAS domain S-box-containing protein